MGFGGSAMMWHREERIGFGYAPTAVNPNPQNEISRALQRVVRLCARDARDAKATNEAAAATATAERTAERADVSRSVLLLAASPGGGGSLASHITSARRSTGSTPYSNRRRAMPLTAASARSFASPSASLSASSASRIVRRDDPSAQMSAVRPPFRSVLSPVAGSNQSTGRWHSPKGARGAYGDRGRVLSSPRRREVGGGRQTLAAARTASPSRRLRWGGEGPEEGYQDQDRSAELVATAR